MNCSLHVLFFYPLSVVTTSKSCSVRFHVIQSWVFHQQGRNIYFEEKLLKCTKFTSYRKTTNSRSILEDLIVGLSADRTVSLTEMERLFSVHHYVQSRFDRYSLWTDHQQERSVTLCMAFWLLVLSLFACWFEMIFIQALWTQTDDDGLHICTYKGRLWMCSETAKIPQPPCFTSPDTTTEDLWGGCGWGGRVVILQPEGRQFNPQSSQICMPKCPWARCWTLLEQQSAANRCTVWMCVWPGECKTVL